MRTGEGFSVRRAIRRPMADESHDPDERAAPDPETALDFGPLSRELADHEFPTANEELLDAFGEYEIGHPDGAATLAEVLGSHDGVTYESAEEVRDAVYNVVTAEPVGKGYDRDGQ